MKIFEIMELIIRDEQISFWVPDFSGVQFYLILQKFIFLILQKMIAQNQSAPPIETQLETLLFALYYLNSTYSLIFNLFPSKVFVMRLL